MTRRVFLPVLILVAVLMSACQPKTPASQPPKDAPVIEAFTKQAACEGLTQWDMEATTKDWIDIGVEWIAIDAETAQDNLKHTIMEIWVDDEPIVEAMKYPQAPEPFSITCGGTLIEGSGVKYALYLPPLTKDEHKIACRSTILEDLNDGWSDYPKGTEFAFTGTVTVK